MMSGFQQPTSDTMTVLAVGAAGAIEEGAPARGSEARAGCAPRQVRTGAIDLRGNRGAVAWGRRVLARLWEAVARPWRDDAMDAELDALRARLDALDRQRRQRRDGSAA